MDSITSLLPTVCYHLHGYMGYSLGIQGTMGTHYVPFML